MYLKLIRHWICRRSGDMLVGLTIIQRDLPRGWRVPVAWSAEIDSLLRNDIQAGGCVMQRLLSLSKRSFRRRDQCSPAMDREDLCSKREGKPAGAKQPLRVITR